MWLDWLLRSECAMPQQHCMTAESAGVSSTMFTFDYQILFQIFQHPRSCNHVQRHPQSGQHALALQAWRDHSRPPGLSAQNRFHQVAGDHQPDSTNAAHSTYAHFFCQNIKQKDAKGELISHNFDANNSSQQLVWVVFCIQSSYVYQDDAGLRPAQRACWCQQFK